VDHQFVLAGRLHRQVARLVASENTIDVFGSSPPLVELIDAVNHEPATRRKISEHINCGQAITRGQHNNDIAVSNRDWTGQDNQAAVRFVSERRNATLDIGGIVYADHACLQAKRGRYSLNRLPQSNERRVVRVENDRYPGQAGDGLFQQPGPLSTY